MLLLRPTTFSRRVALQRIVQSHVLHAPYKSIPTVAFRAFSTGLPPTDAPPAVTIATEEKPKQQKPLTNKKIWDRVLTNHPEQHDATHGDLLYEFSRKSYFGFMGAGSIAHIAFWSWFKGYEQSLIEMMPQASEPSFFSFVTADFGSSIGFGSSILLAFLVGFHARRSVARISVVAGGDKLRITTHKFFGDLGEPFDVPVANVSANPNMKKTMILKLGKDRGFYLVDINGQFYNRKKLESMITFRTDFTEHEKMIEEKEKGKTIEIRTDLLRTDLSSETSDRKVALPKRIVYNGKTKGNLLGRKPSHARKPKGKK